MIEKEVGEEKEADANKKWKREAENYEEKIPWTGNLHDQIILE